jgi:ketosteroid isomerase-like protein
MKTKIATTLLVLLTLSVAGLRLYAQKETDMLKAEIKKMNDKMVKAETDGDAKATASLYTDNAILMPNNEPMIRGTQKMMEKERADMAAGFKMLSMNLTTDDVFPDKLYVTEVGHYVVKMKVPNMPEPMTDNGKYVTIWERQKDGSLKIFIDTWNSDVNPMQMDDKMMQKEKK